VPDPVILDPRDAIVRVELAAICGSDLHVYRGHEAGLDAGTVLGHEFMGEIVALGSEVRGLAVGDRVVCPFSTSCGQCGSCGSHLSSRCTHGELFGWVEGGTGLQGTQAEYARVPLAAGSLVKLPADLPASVPAEASLLVGDVLATGFFCADAARFKPESDVVVLGCGPVGLMAVVGARQLGAGRVFAVDTVPERLDLAESFGATAMPLGADLVERMQAAVDGPGVDCVLEVVGSPQASRLALDLIKPGGTISAVGVHTETNFAFTPGEAYDKNLTYVAGRCPARSYAERMFELLATEKYPVASIFSHRVGLDGGAEGYRIFDAKLDACTKVLLIPGQE
jgi:threonine dehydrogenase-like Zn-dependent dehydrogenase